MTVKNDIKRQQCTGKSIPLKSIYKWGGTPVVLQSDNYRLLPGVCRCVLRLSPSSSFHPHSSSVTTGWLAILPQWGNWTSLAPNPPWQQPSSCQQMRGRKIQQCIWNSKNHRSEEIHEIKYSSIKFSSTQVFKYSYIQVFKYSSIQV